MKKLISTVILSLCLFSFANEISGGASQGKGSGGSQPERPIGENRALALACASHPRLGAGSVVGRLDKTLLIHILQLSAIRSLRITNEDLKDFKGLLKRIGGNIVMGLDLSWTNITDDQLVAILGATGGSLSVLRLSQCHNLANFSSIANCTNLHTLDLSWTNITG